MDSLQMNGKQLRDEGMQLALDNAGMNWQELAYAYLEHYVAHYVTKNGIEFFMGEDIRAWAHLNGLDRPPHARAWGGIIHKASIRGLIRKLRIESVKNPQAHCANASVWAKV